MKSIKYIVLVILAISANSFLFAQNFDWATAYSAGGTSGDQGVAITFDALGNKYMAGNFQSASITLGETVLNNEGGFDIYVAKSDIYGTFQWAVRAGSWDSEEVTAMTVDSAGNLYLTGKFYSQTNFGGIPLSSPGSDVDVFVAKLSTSGSWLWAKRGGGSGEDIAGDIALDESSNVFITGYFRGSASFGATLSASASYTEIYVAKLDTDGNWLWARRAGGTRHDKGSAIDVSGSGDVYVSGYFSLTADFGSTSLTSEGENDVFVAKLDNSGTWIWASRAGGLNSLFVYDSRLDDAASLYLTGYFLGTASFGTTSLSSSGSSDIYAAKIDSGGNWIWAVQAGGPGLDIVNSLAVSDGEVFLTGSFSDTASFGTNALSSIGGNDIFVAKLNGDNWLGAWQAGGTGSDSGLGIALDDNGNPHVTGYFSDLAAFGDISLTSSGNIDIFLAMLSSGTGTGIPQRPANLSITTNGNDIMLSWDTVVSDTAASPLTVDHYRIFYHASDPQGSFAPIGQTETNSWTHQDAALSARGFYYVTAVALE